MDESVLDEVVAITMGAPANINNLVEPSWKVFMARAKMFLEKFPTYNLLSYSQKMQVLECHISQATPLQACRLQHCSTLSDQMKVSMNTDEAEYVNNVSPIIEIWATTTPSMKIVSNRYSNASFDFFPVEFTDSFIASTNGIEEAKRLLKVDYDMLQIFLLLNNLETVTRTDDVNSVVRRYITNLRQLALRKIMSLQDHGQPGAETTYHQVMVQVDRHLQPLQYLYNMVTACAKNSLLQSYNEIGLPKF